MGLQKDLLLKEFDNKVSENISVLKNKKETEEVAERINCESNIPYDFTDELIKMAKWQQEKMYSEEEVLNILHNWSMYKVDIEINNLADELQDILPYYEWFERYKKQNK